MAKTYYDSGKDRIVVEIYPCSFSFIPKRNKYKEIIGAVLESSWFVDGRQNMTSGDMVFLSALRKTADKKVKGYVDQGRIAQAWAK